MAGLYSHVRGAVLGELDVIKARHTTVFLNQHTGRSPQLTVIHEERHHQLLTSTPYGQLLYYATLLAQEPNPTVPPDLAERILKASTLCHEAWALFNERYIGDVFGYSDVDFTDDEIYCLSLIDAVLNDLSGECGVLQHFIVRSLMDCCMSIAFEGDEITKGVTEGLVSRLSGSMRLAPDWRLVLISTTFEASPQASDDLSRALAGPVAWVEAKALEAGLDVGELVARIFQSSSKEHSNLFRQLDAIVVASVYSSFASIVGLNDTKFDVAEVNVLLNALGASVVEGLPPESKIDRIVLGGDSNLKAALRLYDINYVVKLDVPELVFTGLEARPRDELAPWLAELLSFDKFADVRWYCAMGFPAWHWFGFMPRDVIAPADKVASVKPIVHICTPVGVDIGVVENLLGERFIGCCMTEMGDSEFIRYMMEVAKRTLFTGLCITSRSLTHSHSDLRHLKGWGVNRLAVVAASRHYEYVLYKVSDMCVLLEVPTVLYGLMAEYDPDLLEWYRSSQTDEWDDKGDLAWAFNTATLAQAGAFAFISEWAELRDPDPTRGGEPSTET